MRNKRRAALKELKEFEARGGNIAALQVKDEMLYTGSHTFTVTLNPQVPGEKLLLDIINALPARRRGPKIRDLAVAAAQGGVSLSPMKGLSVAVQPQNSFTLPTAGAEEKSKSALDKLEDGWS
jgi:hypothetical protein